jgi:hypothetical protein
VLVADSWVEATRCSVVTLLQQEQLNVDTEVSLLKSCVRWSRHQLEVGNASISQTLRDVLNPLLPHIRFLVMSTPQFVQFNSAHPDVLSHQERYKVLASITMQSAELLPDNFSHCRDVRCRNSPFSSQYDKTRLTDVALVYSMSKSHASADQRIYFTAKDDALVLGVTYQAKSDVRDGPVSRLTCDLYKEKLFVALFSEEKGKKICHVWLKRKIKFGSLVDIDLPEPCAIKKGNTYSLRMFFYRDSYFPKLDFLYISNENYFEVNQDHKYQMCHVTNIFVTKF